MKLRTLPIDLPARLANTEVAYLVEALKEADFNRARAAALLGLMRTTLVAKLKKYRLNETYPSESRNEPKVSQERFSQTWAKHVGNVRAVAEELGVSLTTVYRTSAKLGIRHPIIPSADKDVQ